MSEGLNLSIEPSRLRSYSAAELDAYLEMLTNYSTYASRITETVDVDSGALRRNATLTVTPPMPVSAGESADTRPFIMPLFAKRRNSLIDNLSVEDAEGKRLAVLAQHQNRELASAVLHQMLRYWWNELTQEAVTESADEEFKDRLLQRLGSIPLQRSIETSQTLYGEVLTLLGQKGLTDAFRKGGMEKMAQFYCANYVLSTLLVATPGYPIVMKYAYDSAYTDSYDDTVSLARRFAGQRPYRLQIHIPRAFDTPSYHVRMRLPEGQYCARQRIAFENRSDFSTDCLRAKVSSSSGDDSSVDVKQRGSHAKLPYAHTYLHGLHRFKREKLFVRLTLYEVPPGGLANAFLVAVVATMTCLPILLVFPALLTTSQSADIAALLIATPGAAALWVHPRSGNQLFQGPLMARLGLQSVSLLSFLAALLVLTGQALASSIHGAARVAVIVVWLIMFLGVTVGLSLVTISVYWALAISFQRYFGRRPTRLLVDFLTSIPRALKNLTERKRSIQ